MKENYDPNDTQNTQRVGKIPAEVMNDPGNYKLYTGSTDFGRTEVSNIKKVTKRFEIRI